MPLVMEDEEEEKRKRPPLGKDEEEEFVFTSLPPGIDIKDLQHQLLNPGLGI